MTGASKDAAGSNRPATNQPVRIRCQADRRIYEIDVEWMKGAMFEFDSIEEGRIWVEEQNLNVPGTLYLEESTDEDDMLSVDYHLKYQKPE